MRFACNGTYTKFGFGLFKKEGRFVWKKDYTNEVSYHQRNFFIFFNGE